jgi:hypothetical protein
VACGATVGAGGAVACGATEGALRDRGRPHHLTRIGQNRGRSAVAIMD